MGQRDTYLKEVTDIFSQGEFETVEAIGQVLMYDFSVQKYS